MAPVLELRAPGVPVGLATDGPVSHSTLDVLESRRLMAMMVKHAIAEPKNMTISEALTVATRDSARVIGMAKELGHIAPGFLADLILVDLSGPHHQPVHNLAMCGR